MNACLPLTVFYDGNCPLCAAEIHQLRAIDNQQKLRLVNIYADGFSNRFPDVDPLAATKILHGQYSDGSMVYGLDVSHQAWALVGKHQWIAVLRWPVIRWFADMAYLFFARNRQTISLLLTGRRQTNSCKINPGKSNAPD